MKIDIEEEIKENTREHNELNNKLDLFIPLVHILDDTNDPIQNIIIVAIGIKSYNFSENTVNKIANKTQETIPKNAGTNSLLTKKITILKSKNHSPLRTDAIDHFLILNLTF